MTVVEGAFATACAVLRRLYHRKRFVAGMAALLALCGCLASQEPLLAPGSGEAVFGAEGVLVRIDYDRLRGPLQQKLRFTLEDGAYVLGEGRAIEPARYRLQALQGEWLIWQKTSAPEQTSLYGLARREGGRLWTYLPDCTLLSPSERAGLHLSVGDSGACWIKDRGQLRAAMLYFKDRPNKLIGYYEVIGAAPR